MNLLSILNKNKILIATMVLVTGTFISFIPNKEDIVPVPQEVTKEFQYFYFIKQYDSIQDKLDLDPSSVEEKLLLQREISLMKQEYNQRAQGIDPALFEAYDLPSQMQL